MTAFPISQKEENASRFPDTQPDVGIVGASLQDGRSRQCSRMASYRDAAILELFYSCGMRLSELVGLDVGSVDHRFRGVKVMGKGRKERILPVGTPALAALETYVSMAVAEEFSLVCLPYRNPVKRSLRADDAEQICEAVFHSFYHFSP